MLINYVLKLMRIGWKYGFAKNQTVEAESGKYEQAEVKAALPKLWFLCKKGSF